jgi:hypothetical protein
MHYSVFFILTTEEINILAFYRTTPCSVWSDYRHFGRTPVFFFTVEFEVDIFYKKSVTTQTVRFHNPKHRSLYEWLISNGRTIYLGIYILHTFIAIFVSFIHLENLKYFKYLFRMITNDARRTSEIKSRTVMAKVVINKMKALFTNKLDRNSRKKLAKCYIWSVALYGAETWTLRKAD